MPVPVQDELNPMGDYFLIRGKYIDVDGVRLDRVINQVEDDISRIKTDSYTKQQADDKFAAKTNVYTKSEVDTALNGKVSVQSGYDLISDADKAQIQANKANITAAETAIAGKASQSEVETIKTDVAGKASTEAVTQLQTEMAVQEARMDQLVGTVPEGSADEIADARVTADGKTEANLGNAIRSQVSGLKETIDTINDNVDKCNTDSYAPIVADVTHGTIDINTGIIGEHANDYVYSEMQIATTGVHYEVNTGYRVRFFHYYADRSYKGCTDFLTGSGEVEMTPGTFYNIRIQKISPPANPVDITLRNVRLYRYGAVKTLEQTMYNVCVTNQNVVENNTDFDTLKKNGFYVTGSGYTYTHFPYSTTNASYSVEVRKTNNNRYVQIVDDVTNGGCAIRQYAASKWTEWKTVSDDFALKFRCGSNVERKTLDHGGFCERINSRPQYQDSPLAFKRAAKEGVRYHNMDVVFTLDSVPVLSHDNVATDINGNIITISETNWSVLKTKEFGDSNYSYNLLTLEDAANLCKNLDGFIDQIDISASLVNHVDAFLTYIRNKNIRVTWIGCNNISDTALLVSKRNEYDSFGVYAACETEADIQTEISFAQTLRDNNNDVEILFSIFAYLGESVITPYIPQIKALGGHLYAYLFNSRSDMAAAVPVWAEGVLSEKFNVNYELYKKTMDI